MRVGGTRKPIRKAALCASEAREPAAWVQGS